MAIILVMSLFLMGTLTLAFDIQPAKADPTIIYVDDDNTSGPWDGTPEHPYQNITNGIEHAVADDTIFVYNGTYYENVVVNKSLSLIGESRENTIIDGNGIIHSIVCVTSNNVSITGFTIQNCEIDFMFARCIEVQSSGNNISYNTITITFAYSHSTFGIWIEGENNIFVGNTILNHTVGILVGLINNTIISGNDIMNNGYGIHLYHSSNNTLSGNNIANNEYGIDLDYSSNNVLRNNIMTGNGYNFAVSGSSLSDYVNDVDASNTVEGKPIYYWINTGDLAVPLDAGYVALVNSTDITAEGLELRNNDQSILLAYTTNSRITNNDVTNNDNGIELYSSSNNTISGNNITNNGRGIYLSGSNNTIISGNDIVNNGYGIDLYHSSNDTVFGNNMTNNNNGIKFYLSSNNTISRNNIINDYIGVYLSHSSNNTISGNDIVANDLYGIWIAYSSNNTVFGNNIANNHWASGSQILQITPYL